VIEGLIVALGHGKDSGMRTLLLREALSYLGIEILLGEALGLYCQADLAQVN
jgi:hypothetical protein